MCCFSKNVQMVADTNIFARAGKDGRQYVVVAAGGGSFLGAAPGSKIVAFALSN